MTRRHTGHQSRLKVVDPAREVAEVEALPVPPEGEVLFVLTLPADHDGPEATPDLVDQVREVARATAPGRHQVVVLADGLTLEALGDVELATIGLQKIPPDAEP